jgi:hypothetical protein
MQKISCQLTSASAALAAGAVLLSCNPPNYPTRPIELKYYADGPWAVTVLTGWKCCDSLGNKFDLYYPTNLTPPPGGFPILTWGNGTNSTSSNYLYFLKHMASWGFVVIATQDLNTGPGQTILDAANLMIGQNTVSGGAFQNKLNTAEVGAFGHSQGATGAINALKKSGGAIKTVVPIELPAQIFCSSPQNCADTSTLTQGSIFLIDGSLDIPISPPTQLPSVAGSQSIAAYYQATPPGIGKVKGTLIGPSHADVEGSPTCASVALGCVRGVYGYLGYPPAWMRFQLQNDSYAHGAFVNGTGEIFSEAPNWQYVASNLP